MGDISFRAVEVLKSVGAILAEDTRHSRHLLDHYGVTTPLSSYHEHNEARETPRIVGRLKTGVSLALISDAGTPLLSDPGSRLVAEAVRQNIEIVAVPGASALLSALVVSGIVAEPFTFVGFLPRKGRERSALLSAIARSTTTTLIYEAPGRVAATLRDLASSGAGNRDASVSRELTKKFEETVRGPVADLADRFSASEPRGEFVIVIAGAAEVALTDENVRELADGMRREGLSPRAVTDRLVAQHGVARNSAYRVAHDFTGEDQA